MSLKLDDMTKHCLVPGGRATAGSEGQRLVKLGVVMVMCCKETCVARSDDMMLIGGC